MRLVIAAVICPFGAMAKTLLVALDTRLRSGENSSAVPPTSAVSRGPRALAIWRRVQKGGA